MPHVQFFKSIFSSGSTKIFFQLNFPPERSFSKYFFSCVVFSKNTVHPPFHNATWPFFFRFFYSLVPFVLFYCN